MLQESAIDKVATGVYTALNTTGFTGLTALFKYRTPSGSTATYPRSLITGFVETRHDCMQQPGKEVAFQIHTMSKGTAAEPYTINSKAVELLHYTTSFNTSGHETMVVEYETNDTYDEDVGGVTVRHLVSFFRAKVWQTS